MQGLDANASPTSQNVPGIARAARPHNPGAGFVPPIVINTNSSRPTVITSAQRQPSQGQITTQVFPGYQRRTNTPAGQSALMGQIRSFVPRTRPPVYVQGQGGATTPQTLQPLTYIQLSTASPQTGAGNSVQQIQAVRPHSDGTVTITPRFLSGAQAGQPIRVKQEPSGQSSVGVPQAAGQQQRVVLGQVQGTRGQGMTGFQFASVFDSTTASTTASVPTANRPSTGPKPIRPKQINWQSIPLTIAKGPDQPPKTISVKWEGGKVRIAPMSSGGASAAAGVIQVPQQGAVVTPQQRVAGHQLLSHLPQTLATVTPVTAIPPRIITMSRQGTTVASKPANDAPTRLIYASTAAHHRVPLPRGLTPSETPGTVSPITNPRAARPSATATQIYPPQMYRPRGTSPTVSTTSPYARPAWSAQSVVAGQRSTAPSAASFNQASPFPGLASAIAEAAIRNVTQTTPGMRIKQEVFERASVQTSSLSPPKPVHVTESVKAEPQVRKSRTAQ